MRRSLVGTILWSVLAGGIGVGLFFIKHEVKDLERQLGKLTAEIQHEQETIHVLRAEWSYLNDPARLRALAEKHLGMHPVTPAQVATLDSLPRDGGPATGPVYAILSPARIASPAPAARPADAPARAKPAPGPAAPPPSARPAPPPPPQAPPPQGNGEPPPAPRPAATGATVPAHGRAIVIRSPALAQSDGDPR
jgi:cell division protein FtsL